MFLSVVAFIFFFLFFFLKRCALYILFFCLQFNFFSCSFIEFFSDLICNAERKFPLYIYFLFLLKYFNVSKIVKCKKWAHLQSYMSGKMSSNAFLCSFLFFFAIVIDISCIIGVCFSLQESKNYVEFRWNTPVCIGTICIICRFLFNI